MMGQMVSSTQFSLWIDPSATLSLRSADFFLLPQFDAQELAYALEECGEYEDAEAIALGSYSKNEGDSWAAHQIAHVHEMTGRGEEWLPIYRRCPQHCAITCQSGK